MAVMQHSIIFGGVDSADYGIYIGGEGTFNAPERAIEYKEIPGRNGAFALDLGYWNNIEVKYTAVNYEEDFATFSNRLRAFRNALASKKGYQRLEDTFHPDEYRMAVLSDGLEVKPIMYNTAAQFEIKFNCKPQRFLTSGETEIEVTSGQTITNPTAYEASPLIKAYGYGNIEFDGYTININDDPVGNVLVYNSFISYGDAFVNFPYVHINPNDDIDVESPYMSIGAEAVGSTFTSAVISDVSGYSGIIPKALISSDEKTVRVEVGFTPDMTFDYRTALTNKENFTLTLENADGYTKAYNIECGVAYGGENSLKFYMKGAPEDNAFRNVPSDTFMTCGPITIHSTAFTRGNPTYIDCETGEAYTINNGVISSLNAYISFDSRLPVLPSGGSEIIFSDTFSSVRIIPRWLIL